MVAPLLWLVSAAADGISGRRLTANRWNPDEPTAALDEAGWTRWSGRTAK